MAELLDLPKYLTEQGGKVDNVKMLCLLDKQIEMPDHLKAISNNTNTNISALVDIIGVEINNKRYLVCGKAVVILGPRSFETDVNKRKVLLLDGSIVLKQNDYVELTLIYPVKNSSTGYALYATRTLYRDIPPIRNAYPDLMKYLDKLAQMDWDLVAFYNNLDIPTNYRVACGNCNFNEVSEKDKFVFKSSEDYQKSKVDIKRSIEDKNEKEFNKSSTKKNKLKLKDRRNILNKPKEYDVFSTLVDNSCLRVKDKLDNLKELQNNLDLEKYILYTYTQVKKFWKHSPHSQAITGRALFKIVLEHLFPDYKNSYIGKTLLLEDALDKQNVLDIWYSGEIPSSLAKISFYSEVVMNREEIYIGFIDYLLGLRSRLVASYSYGVSLELNMFDLLNYNPYYLSLVDNRLTIEDLDKLALFFNIDLKDSEIIKFRNVAYMHHYLLNSNNDVIGDNTLINKQAVLANIYSGFIISSASYKCLQTSNYLLSEKILNNLLYYVKENFDFNNFSLPITKWGSINIKGTIKYIRPFDNFPISATNILKDYLDSGMGVELSFNNVDYLMDYSYAHKEKYIIDRLYDLQENGDKPVLNSLDIDKCIRAFEYQKSLELNIPNFKLEENQAEAVRSLFNPIMCLTGPAGSGKTTTAEAMLFGLLALLGVDENSVMFAAPTGRAAQRLKEVVKKMTRTIHSLFGIGGESFTILDEDNIKKKSDIKVLIVDESSMINLELMYNMISKIADGTRIIFMGDIEQLPPIGPGKPFANILSFLPCVVLTVTKRASANSGITRNAEALIYNSDGDSFEDLKVYDDFRILETPKNKIIELVTGIVNYHLGRAGAKREGNTAGARRVLQSLDVNLSPDDIQVVTPVNKYEWGTKSLNPILQNVINPRNMSKVALKYLERYEYDESNGSRVPKFTEYRIGDRVIHLENNMHKDRFILKSIRTFEKIPDNTGIMNGDIGKIVGFYLGSDLKFEMNDGSEDLDTREMFADDNKIVYVGVMYNDMDIQGNNLEYVIFYKSDIIETPDIVALQRAENVYAVESNELKKLDLAYALTVHKLQGSQAKLIICVMYPVGYSNFISRNMIYTAITRAVMGVYLVGNVTGWNNVISRGRKIEQTSERLTILDKIYK